jgi:hypothetical protein
MLKAVHLIVFGRARKEKNRLVHREKVKAAIRPPKAGLFLLRTPQIGDTTSQNARIRGETEKASPWKKRRTNQMSSSWS